MRLLLDTHVALWVRTDARELPRTFRDALSSPSTHALISTISLAEIAVKRSIGKLDVDGDFRAGLHDIGLDELPFTGEHATALEGLPLLHRDPFDRMLVAQAIAEDLVFLTVDAQCLRYDVRTL
ncbi:type II toxin-antitoxin system VapC family toxin [Knoellia sp. CPCC 206453]|uniref:type II toxin-antitoxin system VapC family toxin n=1 Tax=Knoellia pratensis TaxID=3404796 RepID=UPI00361AB7B4